MFVLHLDLKVKPANADALNATYQSVFRPAISAQPGFVDTKLLLARASDARTHRLVIVFETEADQKRWVATPLHEEVGAKLQPSMGEVIAADCFDAVKE